MIIIICSGLAVVIGLIIAAANQWDWDGSWEIGLCVFGGIILFISLLALPVQRMGVYATMRSIEQVRTSIEVARTNGRDIELAALAPKIAEYNAEIEKMKYYHETVMRIYWPDEVMEIKPLE